MLETCAMERLRGVGLALLALCLGVWPGAALLFTFAVAPAIFALADRPGEAGEAIAHVLAVLHIGGACVFSSAGLLAWAHRLGAWLQIGPVVLAALCLFSHFGVSGPLAELRERPAEARTAADQESQRRLHRISVAVFSIVGVGNLVLLYRFGAEASGPISQRSNPRIS